MATPRTQQAHQRRVEKVAADAAAIASASPVEREVVIPVEELPTASNGTLSTPRLEDAAEGDVRQILPVMETLGAIARTNITYIQQSCAEQLRFAASVTDAVATVLSS